MRRTFGSMALGLVLAACSGGGDTHTTAPVLGTLEVTVVTPAGVTGSIHVSGPNGYARDFAATTTLTDLVSGRYAVVSHKVTLAGDRYDPAADSVSIPVPAANVITRDTVSYAIATGRVAFFVTGLPSGVPASIAVYRTDPPVVVTGSDTVKGLDPGSLYLFANIVPQGTTTYGGLHNDGSAGHLIPVTASIAPSVDTIVYAAMTGSITLDIHAPPAGLAPQVLLTGPFAYSRSFTTAGVFALTALPLGNYTVSGPNVENATAYYSPNVPYDLPLQADFLAQEGVVSYSLGSGSITVNVSGLPGGTNASVIVIGADSVPHLVTASTTVYKLAPGSYQVRASSVTGGGLPYLPDNQAQVFNVSASLTPMVASVAYAPLDLSIDGMYITQATQTYTGGVPLVANRDGYLRVFVKTNRQSSATPTVRVRWYSSGTLVRTDVLNAPGASVPLSITEDVLASSWNLPVPKTLIQQNLSVLADIDPGNAYTEGNESNNTFPASGLPLALDVRPASIFHVSAVPVKQRFNKLTGNVTAANVDTYFSLLQLVAEFPSYQAAVHAVYTTADSLPLMPFDDNDEWFNILNEMSALQVAEGASDSLYYYAVVHPAYQSGVAGLGWIGAPAAVGWDQGINANIAAHEIGHNWGRYHSPCGGPAGVDPNWPTDPAYANALIGAWGFDLLTNTLIPPTIYHDIMSYCQDQQWTSDYTYKGVMDYRAANPMVVGAASAARQPSLLVWGKMRGGRLVLEPAFEIVSRSSAPTGSGAYSIEGLDAGGGTLFRYAFDGHEAADLPRSGRGFAFAIPLASFDVSRLAALRLAGQEGEVRVAGGAAVAAMRVGGRPASRVTVRSLGGGEVRVTWDGGSYPMAMIRDAATGQVLSFARGGSAKLPARGVEFDVTVSDGVRSATERVIAQ